MDDFRSDPLWELLGRARRPEPSPWLVTRIMAAVRQQTNAASRTTLATVFRWLALPVGAAAVLLAITTFHNHRLQQPAESPQLFAAFEAFADNAFEADYIWSADSF